MPRTRFFASSSQVFQWHVKRPKLSWFDRVMLATTSITATWRDVVLIVKPETILRWRGINLIPGMADENPLWGAERIRGELLKIGIRVAKRTIQKYLRRDPVRPRGQKWSTFLKNHATDTWVCDFLETHDIWFRPIYAFFIVNLGTRDVVRVAVTRSPTNACFCPELAGPGR